ncbi:extracellular solute-binding protein [Ideonella alba]|uniref:Putrescine-binding periplasmic protein n=1 Tax=Ideonella alba TaxID=2824118 RepID=A0A941BN46_9BURK|nr:extracellular solute-binding protein [Ideonella alba]MBQ0932944.1 extracellular solute-binding protein [Ideonella alba]
MTIRRWLRVWSLAALATLAASGSVRADEEKVLNVYNWAEYIGETTIKDFERETGIKVRYDNFDANEVLLAKMVAGRSGYDIVVPSADFGRIMIDGGLARPLDRAQLTNWAQLNPKVMAMMARLDPGNRHMVPWLGSTVSVGYNVDRVKAALGGEPIPANPFELVFNPKYTAKLKSCGISMLDSASDVFPSALIYLGRPAYGNNPADYQDAAALLQKVRADVALFSFNGYIADLASGALCVALGYGGDFNNAQKQATAAGRAIRIEAPLPPGGVQFGFESMVIPADAPHPENAHRWINFILRPEVQAAITNKVMFTTPNLGARALLKPEVLANPIANPPDDYLATRVQFYEVRRQETRRLMTRLFQRVKTGL